jgi:hypothetical protein
MFRDVFDMFSNVRNTKFFEAWLARRGVVQSRGEGAEQRGGGRAMVSAEQRQYVFPMLKVLKGDWRPEELSEQR